MGDVAWHTVVATLSGAVGARPDPSLWLHGTFVAHAGGWQSLSTVATVVLAGAVYWVATAPVGRATRSSRSRWRLAAFLGGLAAVLLAESPPVASGSDHRFSIHMGQHLLFVLVAAPLFVAARPGRALAGAIGPVQNRWVSRQRKHFAWRRLRSPLAGWVAFVGFLWLVHFSSIYEIALDNGAVHLLEHVAFLGVAVWLWRPVIDTVPGPHRLDGAGRVAYLLVLMPAMAFLGLAIASSSSPLYDHYVTTHAGTDPLADQRVGAAIMWGLPVFAMLPVLLGSVVLWWRREERLQAVRDAREDEMMATAARR